MFTWILWFPTVCIHWPSPHLYTAENTWRMHAMHVSSITTSNIFLLILQQCVCLIFPCLIFLQLSHSLWPLNECWKQSLFHEIPFKRAIMAVIIIKDYYDFLKEKSVKKDYRLWLIGDEGPLRRTKYCLLELCSISSVEHVFHAQWEVPLLWKFNFFFP